MNTTRTALTLFAASFALAAAPKTAAKIEAPPQPATAEALPASKVVHVGDRDVVPIRTKLRYTTMIVLPKDETILDFVCGDKEFWVVNGSQNFAFVKPARENGQTNLNLITASGNVYSFTLIEGGEDSHPDLKVFVEPKGESLLASLKAAPRFVPAHQVDDYRDQIAQAQADAAKAREDAAAKIAEIERRQQIEIAKAKAAMPGEMVFDYKYNDQDGFNVSAMYHDDRFMYIKAKPTELPSVYEYIDDKPSLIEVQFSNDTYTVRRIIDRGYLQIGKRKMHFTREK